MRRTRVLRIYHAGRDPAHRRRERALVQAGIDLTLGVPAIWPKGGSQQQLSDEPFPVVELSVHHAGDVNRHRYADPEALRMLVRATAPDLIDIHEEPFSLAARQWLAAAGDLPVVMYTAQNLDKRFPPPFAQYEKRALRRVQAMYPCSRQAASVVRGKGFAGHIDVLPLGIADDVFHPGGQSPDDKTFVLGLVGRMVPEKGVQDAVRVLDAVRRHRPARLLLVGKGPEVGPALDLAADLGVWGHVSVYDWVGATEVAALYRTMHVVLVPSTATATWVEQFGRVIIEGRASGAVVAGYACGSIPEVVGKNGFVCPEGDVAALGAVTIELATNPNLWCDVRRRGVNSVESHAWSEIGRRQARLYALAAEQPPRWPSIGCHPAAARSAAQAEFGLPATTPTSRRPVALPLIRGRSRLDSVVGGVVDLASATVAHVAARRGGTAARTPSRESATTAVAESAVDGIEP